MIIDVICPSCGTVLRAGKQMVGKRADCPSCGEPVVIREATKRQVAEVERRRQLQSQGVKAPSGVPLDPATLNDLQDPDAAPRLVEYISTKRETSTAATDFAVEEHSREYVTIGGYALTRTRLIVGGVVLIAAVLAIWQLASLLHDPFKAKLVDARVVSLYSAMQNLLAIEDEASGATVAMTIGGKEELAILVDDENGDYLLIELDVPNDVFLAFAEITAKGQVLDASRLTIRGGHTDADVSFVAYAEAGPLVIDLTKTPAKSGWEVLPADIMPDREQETGEVSVRLTYDSHEATGEVTVRPRDPAASSAQVFAKGQVFWTIDGDEAIHYRYEGQSMSIGWGESLTGVYARDDIVVPRGSATADSRRITILAARPRERGEGRLSVWAGDQMLVELPRGTGKGD